MGELDARNNNKLEEYEKRPCKHCGRYRTYEGHDGCLGELIGIANACCGHGNINKAYVQFLDGVSIDGEDAIAIQDILKKHSINYNGLNCKKEDRLKFLMGNIPFYKDAWNL